MGRNRVFKKIKKGRINNIPSRKSGHVAVEVMAATSEKEDISTPSTSRQKLSFGLACKFLNEEGDNLSLNSGYRLVDIELLSHAISSTCCCLQCGKQTMILIEDNKRIGLMNTFSISCKNCENKKKFNSSKSENRLYECNVKFVYAMRCLGIGREGANLFCSLMNMPPPLLRFDTINSALVKCLSEVCEESFASAAKQAIEENEGQEDEHISTDLTVSCDGTWMKRGHKSHFGVSTVIAVYTGKILDLEVMSNYCQECVTRKQEDKEKELEWQKVHEENCQKNYLGVSSGGMEATAMVKIFNRSITKHGVRYRNYLGDGDSSAYKSVCDSDPYGPNCVVTKYECIGHVQKRMGGRLLKLHGDPQMKKLEDGKGIGGKDRLTKNKIKELQSYYGMAIRNNIQDVQEMKKAIWAIYFHTLSTDDNPQHGLCSVSWCKYKKMQESGKPYSHKHSLPVAVMNAMKPTFRALSDHDLLSKCTHGKTQNPNESLNSLIWKRCPKTTFASLKVVKIAAFDAALVFNDGNAGRVAVIDKLGFSPGVHMVRSLADIDKKRITAADNAIQNMSQFAQRMRRAKRASNGEQEDSQYSYGGF